jgi:hypothetical protein
MDPFHAIADLYSRTALPDLAHSALPNAPVLPDDAPRAVRARMNAIMRKRIKRPQLGIRRAQYSPGCSSP